ncbi:unnamed protein product [Rotaria sordida]|uniref:F-box domain-containing protein n=1 Tax=Rotaria sordida TaxID=392033 RepID=A0A815WSP2_9BILA|nr:unnamed protein product [Rotaria sordida]CAF1548408.1 unnamed protein product [Rotaria sordida]
MSTAMKFEFLPNEIFIDCFEYLNAPDLFRAFDGLNYRFQKLITNIPLGLNFQHINKSMFDQFCDRMIANPGIKSKIVSLKLSNDNDTCGEINSFLSLFSLNEFPNLQSLTLIEIERDEMERVALMLSSLSNLHYFHCHSFVYIIDTIVTVLPTLKEVRKLTLRDFFTRPLSTLESTSIKYLTMYLCDEDRINILFKFAPNLKYFNIELLRKRSDAVDQNYKGIYTPANSLIQFHLNAVSGMNFDDIERLFKQTPKLKILALSIDCPNIETINTDRWQNLILSVLPHLKVFKFDFQVNLSGEEINGIHNKLEQFQNDFWIKQHRWYTAYEIIGDKVYIFTIPYFKKKFTLPYGTQLFYNNNTSIDKSKLFDNVKELTLCLSPILKYSDITFSNVESLQLTTTTSGLNAKDIRSFDVTDFIEYLKKSINLSKIKHLQIKRMNGMQIELILLEIFEKSPYLSSMSIYNEDLIKILTNADLCGHFNKMITKLEIHGNTFYSEIVKDICQKFSNLEQLNWDISKWNLIPILFNQLPKLSNFSSVTVLSFNKNNRIQLKEYLSKLNGNFIFYGDEQGLNTWINRH